MVELDGQHLDLGVFETVVYARTECGLTAESYVNVRRSRDTIARIVAGGEAVYGVNTGFGDLASVRIADENLSVLQERLILSHAAGVGEPLSDNAVRGMLLLRANTLARGHSGVRVELVEALLALLNNNVLPIVPRQGSVGASGDLAPLAHLALPLLGKGQVRVNGEVVPAAQGLAQIGLQPMSLMPKEGLALINGTQAMTALLGIAVSNATRLTRLADLVAALSTEALRGTDAAFDPRLHRLRPHPGQLLSARNLWDLMQGSEIRASHRQNDVRIQDPYSIRCSPQVHGAARDVLDDVSRKLTIEMNSVTDNQLVFPDDDVVLSGGNFHGEPMAIAADVLAIAMAELGAISERRIEKLTNTAFSGLPAFLVEDAGLNSGFMIAQVTAAALASENKTYCHPASVDSIPTSADKEDHVSMGMGAALKLQHVIHNTKMILGIELLSAAQGIDLLRPLRSGPVLEEVHALLRKSVAPWTEDREMSPAIEAAIACLDNLDPFLTQLV